MSAGAGNGSRGLDPGRAWVVGCVGDWATLLRAAEGGAPGCDAVEVRLDLLGEASGDWMEACRAVRERGPRVLLTLRQAREGGRWAGRPAVRWGILRRALEGGAADAVDWEIHAAGAAEMAERLRGLGGAAAWVASWHRFAGSCGAKRLAAETSLARRMGARWVKLAVAAEDEGEWERLRRAWKDMARWLPSGMARPCLVPMGREGGRHRVEVAGKGGALLFGTLGQNGTAPGQPGVGELGR